jgi:hypothetical protein
MTPAQIKEGAERKEVALGAALRDEVRAFLESFKKVS